MSQRGSGRFDDEVVVVTGGSGLIGSACVAGFLAEGATVVSLDVAGGPADGGAYSGIDPATFETERLGTISVDLRAPGQIEDAFDELERRFGPASVLVNNAAVYGRKAFLDLGPDDLLHVYGVNVFGLLLCSQRAVLTMVDRGIEGRIVNVTSTSSQQSDPFSVGYDSSKGAVDAATRAMAVALGQHGIRVNAVGPGEMIKSQEVENLRAPTELSSFEQRRIPIGRVATPQEVADAVLFLASSQSRGISGSIVWVDGGTLGTWTTPGEED
jgi:glucose 1-dehydrogenase